MGPDFVTLFPWKRILGQLTHYCWESNEEANPAENIILVSSVLL